jgi:hypothetical protein
MDAIGESVEREVNDALPYPFKFHKVNKIVVCLGPTPEAERDYVELLGVGLKQWPEFNLSQYVSLSDSEKTEALRRVVTQTFAWLLDTFPDAQFVEIAKGRPSQAHAAAPVFTAGMLSQLEGSRDR